MNARIDVNEARAGCFNLETQGGEESPGAGESDIHLRLFHGLAAASATHSMKKVTGWGLVVLATSKVNWKAALRGHS